MSEQIATAAAERWRLVANLFDELLELPQAQRDQHLQQRCAGDDALRSEVQALLKSAETAADFMEEPVRELAMSLLDAASQLSVEELLPERIGPFRVEREIGHGGMGRVFLGERDDGQFEQQVALKIARNAFGTAHLARRFLEERQILARLTHSHIAQLIDGGITAEGVPWFAMEYVEGTPIDRYCDEHTLDIDARLALFLQVCDAVEYAHRRLVIHRDLKPDNILVTASGNVKLLDFGIAKLIDPSAEGRVETHATRYLTPEFASPEQLRGDIATTATDVYALGALLYLLLAGRHAYGQQNDSLAAWARRFSASPPPPSSLVYSPAGDLKSADSISDARGLSTQRLRRRLRGDLDAIAVLALQPAVEERYPSVEQIAADVRSYLRGMPVSARVASRGYAIRKFLLRHRLAASAAAFALFVLITFATVATVQSRRISVQAQRIETERDKARTVASFLVDLLGTADPYRPSGVAPSVRDVLDRGADRVDRDLGKQPEVQAELMLVMAQAFFGLGELERAGRLIEKSAGLLRAKRSQSVELASALNYLGQIRLNQRRPLQAESLYVEALRQRRALLSPDDPAITLTLSGLGSALRSQGRHDEAESVLRDALARERARRPINRIALAQMLRNLAHSLRDRDRYAEAEPLYRETLTLHEQQLGRDHPETANSMVNLGNTLFRQRQLEQAEPFLRSGVRNKAATLGERHWDVLEDRLTLADLLTARRNFAEADALYASVLKVHRETLKAGHRQIGDDLYKYGRLRLATGDFAGARAMLREALAIYRGDPIVPDVAAEDIVRLLSTSGIALRN